MKRGVSALEYAGPASSSTTDRDPSADSRAASAAPDDPAPTTTTSNPDPTNASSRDGRLEALAHGASNARSIIPISPVTETAGVRFMATSR
jgi:hypothetical protein